MMTREDDGAARVIIYYLPTTSLVFYSVGKAVQAKKVQFNSTARQIICRYRPEWNGKLHTYYFP